ncbi:MAG TPA: Tim44 domain-containing protein [Rhodospirillaceae bacterium]|nr:Tim44 domain-containing protein [Rhodospirillaceae bacterium]
MNDQFIDIILFAMVAVFLGLRLRSVLGRRTGAEPPAGETPAFSRPPVRPAGDTVVDLPSRRQPATGTSADDMVTLGLTGIAAADPRFDVGGFVEGAKRAFAMIVEAFAKGDEQALRPLLSDEVFHNFHQAIAARLQAGETCHSELEQIVSADIVEAVAEGATARIVMRFVTRQLILVKSAAGAVVEGNPNQAVRLTDLWTFARDLRSADPNWLLVATRSQEE